MSKEQPIWGAVDSGWPVAKFGADFMRLAFLENIFPSSAYGFSGLCTTVFDPVS